MNVKAKNHFPPLAVLMVGALAACSKTDSPHPTFPKIFDDRLAIELIAEQPDIVTPIGLAIDQNDVIYVLESHTHTPPSDYSGPKYDLIKRGVDQNEDGVPEEWSIYADSVQDGMNLAILPDGQLICVQKDQVLAFRDTNGDGVGDQHTSLLVMDPPDNIYDHAGLLGVAFDDQYLYISRGNTGSNFWKIRGSDGSEVEGYGDGGNVLRCRWDGSEVEIIATGFWNPFDLTATSDGRLLLVDNDPDSRGPNRLIEVVPGGDYGYQSLYGGSGIHPFLAWNGELPGTLPYAAGIGEAPSGVFDASYSHLPRPYAKSMLSTIWEENNIVHIPLQGAQSSIQGMPEVLVQGDSTFHPVALASNSKGDIYLTDWVVRQYPNHGSGKIWRIKAKQRERKPANRGNTDDKLGRGYYGEQFDKYKEQLASEDRFLRAIARYDLQSWENKADVLSLLQEESSALRLEGLLISTAAKHAIDGATLLNLLRDESMEVRRQGLIYIARSSRTDLLPDLRKAMQEGFITPDLLATYLATIRHLQPAFVSAYQNKSFPKSRDLPRKLPEGFIADLIKDASIPEEVRAAALIYLDEPEQHLSLLLATLKGASPKVKSSIFQLLRNIDQETVAEVLLTEALSKSNDWERRAQALVALNDQSSRYCETLSSLMEEPSELLQAVVLRYLERCGTKTLNAIARDDFSSRMEQIWQKASNPATVTLQSDKTEDWVQLVKGDGDPQIGEMIFQSSWAICQTCHQVEGWGGVIGPDLSHIGSSKSVEQLVRAIVDPSAEIAPEWQGWFVTSQEGKTHYGRQIDVGLHSVELMLLDGEFVTFKEPKDYGISPNSLMTPSLQNNLSAAEFNDLIHYLVSLK